MARATRKHTTNPPAIAVAIALAAAIAALSIYAIKEHHTLRDWPGIPDTTGGRDFARPQTGGDQ
jgi:hypothetical protein